MEHGRRVGKFSGGSADRWRADLPERSVRVAFPSVGLLWKVAGQWTVRLTLQQREDLSRMERRHCRESSGSAGPYTLPSPSPEGPKWQR